MIDKYREIARRLDIDADALDQRAAGYRMTGSRLARQCAVASFSARETARYLREMRDAEDRERATEEV